MRRRQSTSLPARQRGVALIMAVLIVALATILAVNVTFRGMVDQRRSANLFALDQGFEVALGAEGWAADILRKDAQDSQTDHLGEIWATSLSALPIDEGVGTVEGRIEDGELLGTGGEHGPERPVHLRAIAEIDDLECTNRVVALGRRDGEAARAEETAEADGARQEVARARRRRGRRRSRSALRAGGGCR